MGGEMHEPLGSCSEVEESGGKSKYSIFQKKLSIIPLNFRFD